MIEAPDLVTSQIMIFAIVFGFLGLSIVLALKDQSFFGVIFAIISLVFLIIMIILVIHPITNEWSEKVELEIESGDCDYLKEAYYFEDYRRFQDEIKAEFLFDCVQDKQGMEMFLD